MIDCLLFRAAGLSFYRGRIQGKPIMLMGVQQLTTQQLHNLQKIKRKPLDGFIMLDGKLQLSDGQQFILVSDGLKLYEPVKFIPIREALCIFLSIVSCYLKIKYAIWGRVSINDGLRQAGFNLSEECLLVDRDGRVRVCDLGGLHGKYALKEDITSARRIWRYLSRGSQMEQSTQHRKVYEDIGGFGCLEELEKWLQKSLDSYRLMNETQNQCFTRLSLKNIMAKENQPPPNVSAQSSKRKLRLAKNSSRESYGLNKIKGTRQNRLILSQFLRSDQDLVETEMMLEATPNRQQRSYLKKRHSNSIRNIISENQTPPMPNKVQRQRHLSRVVKNEKKLVIGTSRQLKQQNEPKITKQEYDKNQPQEMLGPTQHIQEQMSVHLQDIVLDKIESSHQAKIQKDVVVQNDESTSNTYDGQKKQQQEPAETAETQPTQHNNVLESQHQQLIHEHDITEPRTSSSSISTITPCLLYNTLFQRYQAIVQAVSEVGRTFKKVEVGCRPALFLLYKKYLHIRMCLLDCLKSDDNPLELPQWEQLSHQAEYKVLLQQIDQENQELLKSCVKMREQLKCNFTKEQEQVYEIAKAGHIFDRNLLLRSQNLYNRLKQRAIGSKCRGTLQLVCRYVRAILISFECEMAVPPNLEASLGAFNSFLTEAEGHLEQLYQKICPIES